MLAWSRRFAIRLRAISGFPTSSFENWRSQFVTSTPAATSSLGSFRGEKMGEWNDFRLFFGYMLDDHVSETAQKLDLRNRVAAVLHGDYVPHAPLYWDLVNAFMEALAHDGVVFEIDRTLDGPPDRFTSVAVMQEYVRSCPKIAVPFNRATFLLQGTAIAFIESWDMAGPCEPFYDSWTFFVYLPSNDVTSLRDTCYAVCRKHGLPIEEEMHGSAVPRIHTVVEACRTVVYAVVVCI